jgi:hypothetical protein
VGFMAGLRRCLPRRSRPGFRSRLGSRCPSWPRCRWVRGWIGRWCHRARRWCWRSRWRFAPGQTAS